MSLPVAHGVVLAVCARVMEGEGGLKPCGGSDARRAAGFGGCSEC